MESRAWESGDSYTSRSNSLSYSPLSHHFFSHSLHACSLTLCIFSHSLLLLSILCNFCSHFPHLLSLPDSSLTPSFLLTLFLTPHSSYIPCIFSQSLILLSLPTCLTLHYSLHTTSLTPLLSILFFSHSPLSHFQLLLSVCISFSHSPYSRLSIIQ